MFGYYIWWKIAKKWVRIQTAKQLLKMFPGFNQRQFSNIVTGDNTSNEKKMKQKWETKRGRRCVVPKYHKYKEFGTFIYITIMLNHCDTTKPVKQLFYVREGYIATRIILSKSSLMRLFPKSENSLSGFRFKLQEALHSRIGQCHRRLPRTVTHTRDRFIK